MTRKVADVFVVMKGEVPDRIFQEQERNGRITTQRINNYK